MMEVEEDDLEFESLVRDLSPDMSAAEHVYFDADSPISVWTKTQYFIA